MKLHHVLSAAAAGAFLTATFLTAAPEAAVTWTFDSLEKIGGHKPLVLGSPKVVDTPNGKAVEFDGVDDGLEFDVHPLQGAEAFTWEAIFRPDGGQVEQRWFHLNENPKNGAATGADTESRMLFEIRVVNNQWCLDAFAQTPTGRKALLNRQHLHPLGKWYHVAAVYDGKEFKSYINREVDGSAELKLSPMGPGKTAVGVRLNRVFYFKGAVQKARFTKKALTTGEFLPIPKN